MPNSNLDAIGDVQAAISVGAAIGDVRQVPQSPSNEAFYTVVPQDYQIESLEQFMPRPHRVRQKVATHDADSFIAYVNEFKRVATHLFFNQEREEFVAILDYHEALGAVALASWCDHTASFQTRRSEEFKAWIEKNRKAFTQVDFARFLEENMPDIVEPDSAELLAMALTFEAKKSVEFASGVRLNNGQVQFTYDEIVRGTSQKGTMEIPEQFVLGIPIHVGGPAYRMPVRLRWRLQEGKVSFWYELVRPHRFIEDALKEIRERIAKETGVAVLAGVAAT